MAQAKKCDRCGALYEEVYMGEVESVIHNFAQMLKPKDDTITYQEKINSAVDLCAKCENSFMDWWKAGKKNANKED